MVEKLAILHELASPWCMLSAYDGTTAWVDL